MLICVGVSSATLSALYFTSTLTKDIYRGNFLRDFARQSELEQLVDIDIEYNSFYIAGQDDKRVYLANYTNPLLVATYTIESREIKRFAVKIVGFDSIERPNICRMRISGSNLYIMHGVHPMILRGKIDEWTVKPLIIKSDDYFDQCVPVSPNSFLFRYFSKSASGFSIGKKNLYRQTDFIFNHEVLTRQGDGIFSLDGMLDLEEHSKKAAYIYTYRNEFVVMDTNLSIIKRGRTIDEFSKAGVRSSEVEKGRTMLSGQSNVVNKTARLAADFLYVESNVLAKNEISKDFQDYSVIDVYSVSDGKYQESFHLITKGKGKLSDFHILGNRLVGIIGERLVIFRIPFEMEQRVQ